MRLSTMRALAEFARERSASAALAAAEAELRRRRVLRNNGSAIAQIADARERLVERAR